MLSTCVQTKDTISATNKKFGKEKNSKPLVLFACKTTHIDLIRLSGLLLDTRFRNLEASVHYAQSCKSCLLQIRSVIVVTDLGSKKARINMLTRKWWKTKLWIRKPQYHTKTTPRQYSETKKAIIKVFSFNSNYLVGQTAFWSSKRALMWDIMNH